MQLHMCTNNYKYLYVYIYIYIMTFVYAIKTIIQLCVLALSSLGHWGHSPYVRWTTWQTRS